MSALVCYSSPVDWRWSKGGRGCENDPNNNDPGGQFRYDENWAVSDINDNLPSPERAKQCLIWWTQWSQISSSHRNTQSIFQIKRFLPCTQRSGWSITGAPPIATGSYLSLFKANVLRVLWTCAHSQGLVHQAVFPIPRGVQEAPVHEPWPSPTSSESLFNLFTRKLPYTGHSRDLSRQIILSGT